MRSAMLGARPHGPEVSCAVWEDGVSHVLISSVKAVFVDTDRVPARDSRVGDLVQNEPEARMVYQVSHPSSPTRNTQLTTARASHDCLGAERTGHGSHHAVSPADQAVSGHVHRHAQGRDPHGGQESGEGQGVHLDLARAVQRERTGEYSTECFMPERS